MTDCECPHLYGRPDGKMCTFMEEAVESGAPGNTNYSCRPKDRADFNATRNGTILTNSRCPAANPGGAITLRLQP